MRYWLPVMPRSVVRPSIRALATGLFVSTLSSAVGRMKSVPLLRSRKLSRYKIDTAGRSLKSNVLSNFFSLMVPGTISKSLAEDVDTAGASFFSEAIVTSVLTDFKKARVEKSFCPRSTGHQAPLINRTTLASLVASNDARTWVNQLKPRQRHAPGQPGKPQS